ncbi:putative P-loop containing nucleoside triphosphate hydrolase, clpA/ClpB, AAA lid [Helianthus annuus]|nr:putative P-loop containing nucleoside triphosphate hydrolase, clpA/ClpB, AAA lid [Helianthus annuus]KAJ0655361.1 putative P-loop containing nucleoside triphosphate hydrolase, clpA/ClpB, AAA lid [Helianthus annuus]
MDAGNLLKPMLSRRELRCIGATTLDEYRKYIEKDRSLEHRFRQPYVNQPTVEDTVSIFHGLHERYELHHGVCISDNALVEAAILSDRSISGRFLPDKAIVLVDEAAAKLKMEITSKPTALDEISGAVLKLEMERLSLTSNTDKASKDRIKGLHLMKNTMGRVKMRTPPSCENLRTHRKKDLVTNTKEERVIKLALNAKPDTNESKGVQE